MKEEIPDSMRHCWRDLTWSERMAIQHLLNPAMHQWSFEQSFLRGVLSSVERKSGHDLSGVVRVTQ